MKTLFILLLIFFGFKSFAGPEPAMIAVFDSKKNNVTIKWQHNDDNIFQYIIQRSADNFTWSDLNKISSEDVILNKLLKFTDQRPVSGKGYYRLKIFFKEGRVNFTKSIMVIIGKPGNNWLMYPVPVRSVLNLQYNGSELIPGVISVFIQTMKGQVITRLRLASTTRLIQIPIDNLGKGTYDIRIIIKDEVVWNQRFIK